MKKKTERKKLVLAKETVRGLDSLTLGKVAGASNERFLCTADTLYNSCNLTNCQQEPYTYRC